MLDDGSESLLGLRITTPGELPSLRQKLVEFVPDSLEGLAVPARGEVFVKASSVELVAHELTHVLSCREGYPERWRDVVLPPEAPGHLVDLDALVGVWCRSEGEAVVTARAASAFDAGGRSAAEEALSRFPAVDIADSGRRMIGPIGMTAPDGVSPTPGRGATTFC